MSVNLPTFRDHAHTIGAVWPAQRGTATMMIEAAYEIEDLRGRLTRALHVLHTLTFGFDGQGDHIECSSCQERVVDGHAKDCALTAVLAENPE